MSFQNETPPYKLGFRSFLPIECAYHHGSFPDITYQDYCNYRRCFVDKLLIDQHHLEKFWNTLFNYDSNDLCNQIKSRLFSSIIDVNEIESRLDSHRGRHYINLIIFHLLLYSNRPFRNENEQQFYCYCLQTYKVCASALQYLGQNKFYTRKSRFLNLDYHAVHHNNQNQNFIWYRDLQNRHTWKQFEQECTAPKISQSFDSGIGESNNSLASLAASLGIEFSLEDSNFLDDLEFDPRTARSSEVKLPSIKIPTMQVLTDDEYIRLNTCEAKENYIDVEYVDDFDSIIYCYATEVQNQLETVTSLESPCCYESLNCLTPTVEKSNSIPFYHNIRFTSGIPDVCSFSWFKDEVGPGLNLMHETVDSRPP